MKIVATGVITQLSTKEKEKSNGKTFIYGKAKIVSAQGRGLIVDVTRTLGADKSPLSIGQEVTLHGDTERVMTNQKGDKFMTFEVQTGVPSANVNTILNAFGVQAAAAKPALEPVA